MSFLFWALAAAMLAIALAFVLPPLLGRPRKGPRKATQEAPAGSGAKLDLGRHRERLAALEAELAHGTIDSEGYARGRDEIGRALLADLSPAPEESSAPRARRSVALAVAVIVPLASLSLYHALGSSEALSQGPGQSESSALTAGELPPVEEMVSGLAARLEREPDDGQGWMMLGRSYMVLERFAEARDAYARAHALLGDRPELLVDYAEAVALASGNRLGGRPSELLERALELEPEHAKGLWLAGFAALQAGQTETALARWRTLLERLPAGSEEARAVRDMLTRAGEAQGEAEAATPAEAPSAGPALEVRVAIDPALAERVSGDETLFVFARAVEGPPVPLAVVRRRAAELPLTVALDDTTAMSPELKLSDHGRVIVAARISRSGTAGAQSGDLEGRSGPVEVADGAQVELTITEVVP